MTVLSLLGAGLLDLLLGDPYRLPHPVRWIGRLIGGIEKILYPKIRSDRREFVAGFILCILVVVTCGGSVFFVLVSLHKWSPVAVVIGEILLGFYCISARSLVQEADKVRKHLAAKDLSAARHALSMIVGRDTENLDEEGIVRATVETVAENIVDGIVSPIFFLAVGGPVMAIAFKSVSTMDSMIGYRNDRYRSFGTCAARLDDVLNFVPARLAAFFLVPCAAFILRYDWQQSIRIVSRDRLKHDSPNSAHGEAAVAGALGLRLGGESFYRGVRSEKPYLGDRECSFHPDTVIRVNRIAVVVALLALLLCTTIIALQAGLNIKGIEHLFIKC
jgi:adenosylcobinamide-phosphate synthase